MIILNTGRGAGKTTTLVEWVKQDPQRILAVRSYNDRVRMIEQFSLSTDQIIVSHKRGLRLGQDVEIAVDEAEELITTLLREHFGGAPVKVISSSMPEDLEDTISVDGKEVSTAFKQMKLRNTFVKLSQTYGMMLEEQADSLLRSTSIETEIATGNISYFAYEGEQYYPGFMFKVIPGTSSKYTTNKAFALLLDIFHQYSVDDNDLFIYLASTNLNHMHENPISFLSVANKAFHATYNGKKLPTSTV